MDDRQIGPEGAPVRCSVCMYVFRVEPPSRREASWQIRTAEDLCFTAPDLPTLRTWIREGRLHPDDTVSRTGKNWLRLGDMPEFSEVFRGFGGLPEVFVEMAPDAASAMDELGPPPSFGTEAQGTPVEAVVPAPSEVIDVGGRGGRPASGPTSGVGVPSPIDDRADAPAELDDTSVTAVITRPAQETASGRVASFRDPSVGTMDQQEDRGSVLDAPRDPESSQSGAAGRTAVVQHAEIHGTPVVDGAPSEGIPAATPRRVSPSGHDVADPGAPASMLDAVTAHVKPFSAVESGARDFDATAAEPVAPGDVGLAEVSGTALPQAAARRSPAPRELRSGRSGPLYAGLGLLIGFAMVLGIPTIRTTVLGWAGLVVGEPGPGPNAALVAARDKHGETLARLDPLEVDAWQTALAAQIEGEDDAQTKARLQLLQTELSAAVVFELRIKGAVAVQAARAAGEPSPAVSVASSEASADLERAVQALPAVASAAADPIAAARAAVRAAAARAVIPRSLGALGSDAVATELQLVAAAAPWLVDPAAKVPTGLIGGLAELPEPSATASLLLSLAYWRAGDEARALTVANDLLARSQTQPTAKALVAAVAAASQGPETSEGTQDTGAEPEDGREGETEADEDEDPGAAGQDRAAAVPDHEGASGAVRLSTDQLIARGCGKVDDGEAAVGVELLKRAYGRRPRDVDTLVCLGQGFAKLGRHSTALTWFERALGVSESFRPALSGAAAAAAKLSRPKAAVRYYKRLLAIDPGSANATAYIEAHDPASAAPSGPSTSGPPSSGAARDPIPPATPDARATVVPPPVVPGGAG